MIVWLLPVRGKIIRLPLYHDSIPTNSTLWW